MAFDLEDLGWTRPPPGNLVAFLAAGLTLRRMHRHAQRGDDDEPPIRDDHLPAVAATPVPDEENAPDSARARRADAPRRDVAARPTRNSRPSTPPRGDRVTGTPTTSTTRPPTSSSTTDSARACRFCLVGDDDVDVSGAPLVCDQLVAPCACSGTQKWVHVGCLRRWQHVSVRDGGARRSTCEVCKSKYRVSRKQDRQRESASKTLSRWFSPRAAYRVASYKRAWWQIATNTVLAQEGVPRLGTPAQVIAVLAATELRIWGQREARGGNKVMRFLQAAARKITNTHSAALLAWIAVLGARSAGDALGGPGGVLDGIVDRLVLELRHEAGFGNARIGNPELTPADEGDARRRAPRARRLWRGKRFFLWACRRAKETGGILGVVIRRVAQPGAGAALRVAEPAQNVVSFVERFPQYRVA